MVCRDQVLLADFTKKGVTGAYTPDAQSEGEGPRMVRSIIYDKVTALTAAQGMVLDTPRGISGVKPRPPICLTTMIWRKITS